MNSMRFIQAAIEVEARRQIALLEAGKAVTQETRLYDPDRGETRSMRSKEEAHDYRYFPDPDLLPLVIERAWVDDIAASLPELPDAKKARFIADGLSDYDASVLTADTADAAYFEAVAAVSGNGKASANWVVNDLFGRLKKDGREIGDSPVSPDQLGGIIRSDRGGRHLGQDRQGPVRDRLHGGRRPRGDRGGARHAAGHGYRRHRGGAGRDRRGQPRAGRKGARQSEARRLVRRAGDEGDRRKGEPAGGQRDRGGEAGGMMARRDELVVWTKRVKLLAGTVNAIALGLVGFAVLRPATENVALLSPVSLLWGVVGLALHVFAHYILGKLKRETTDDEL